MIKVRYKINSFLCIEILMMILINIHPCFSFSKNQLINYIQMNQIWELTDDYGGFKNSVMENASVDVTAKAIICLSELQVVNQTINDAAISYISSCEQFMGGFSIDTSSNIPNLRSTYWAISALFSIQSLDWVSNKTPNWIVDRQLLNISEPWNYGGFENKVNSCSATTEYIFYGIMAVNRMSKLSQINTTATLFWLKSRQLEDGGFEYMDGYGFSDLASTFYAVSALSILNGFELINISSLISFLTQKQNLNISDPVNYGGFGDAPNISCDGIDTFFAIHSLHLLNALSNTNISAAKLYLENLQLSNGAFTIAQGIDQPCISFSYYALTALVILSLYEERDNSGELNSIFLVLLICIGGISSLLIIKFLKNRKIKGRSLKIIRKKKKIRRTIHK